MNHYVTFWIKSDTCSEFIDFKMHIFKIMKVLLCNRFNLWKIFILHSTFTFDFSKGEIKLGSVLKKKIKKKIVDFFQKLKSLFIEKMKIFSNFLRINIDEKMKNSSIITQEVLSKIEKMNLIFSNQIWNFLIWALITVEKILKKQVLLFQGPLHTIITFFSF